jgi:O-antigen ligase
VCLLLSSRTRLIGLGVIVVSALTLLVFWPQIRSSSTYQNRFDQTQNVDARLVLQKVSIKLAEERPILGWGYDSFDRVKHNVVVNVDATALAAALQSTSHNTFLTLIVEFGVVGLIVFVLPWALVLWRALRRARIPGPDQWVLVAGIASVAVVAIDAGTLDFRFYSFLPALPWMFLGLLRRELVPDEVVEPALQRSVRPAPSPA